MNRCLKCNRSGSTCYCDEIRAHAPIVASTQIVILRHPRERKRSVGTAQMTHLMLKGSRLITDRDFDGHPQVQAITADPERVCVVLFPKPGCRNIEENPFTPQELLGKKLTVFVIDGTWLDARQILRSNPGICSLPAISFNASKESEYQFRKQPAEHCLSTIESIQRVLSLTEPGLSTGALLEVFRSMVQTQLEFSRNDLVRMPSGRPRRQITNSAPIV
ncbi:MAG: DTW domain-containing protein [Bdellovibrionales bacterium]|nr:DTW domain-containing protein [Bdellovibrionales bacterium]